MTCLALYLGPHVLQVATVPVVTPSAISYSESATTATINRPSCARALPLKVALALFQAPFTYASATRSRGVGIMTKRSRYSYSDTIAKLTKAMTDGGATIFATIDQSAAATECRPNAAADDAHRLWETKGWHPMMEAFPLVALELPVKAARVARERQR